MTGGFNLAEFELLIYTLGAYLSSVSVLGEVSVYGVSVMSIAM